MVGFCEKWWMIAVRGVVALGFGLLVLLWPGIDANVLALGARVVGVGVAEGILESFRSTAFEGGRHAARVQKIDR